MSGTPNTSGTGRTTYTIHIYTTCPIPRRPIARLILRGNLCPYIPNLYETQSIRTRPWVLIHLFCIRCELLAQILHCKMIQSVHTRYVSCCQLAMHSLSAERTCCVNAKSRRSTRCTKRLNSAAKLIQRTISEAPQGGCITSDWMYSAPG